LLMHEKHEAIAGFFVSCCEWQPPVASGSCQRLLSCAAALPVLPCNHSPFNTQLILCFCRILFCRWSRTGWQWWWPWRQTCVSGNILKIPPMVFPVVLLAAGWTRTGLGVVAALVATGAVPPRVDPGPWAHRAASGETGEALHNMLRNMLHFDA
jgi:hypothetical protein